VSAVGVLLVWMLRRDAYGNDSGLGWGGQAFVLAWRKCGGLSTAAAEKVAFGRDDVLSGRVEGKADSSAALRNGNAKRWWCDGEGCGAVRCAGSVRTGYGLPGAGFSD